MGPLDIKFEVSLDFNVPKEEVFRGLLDLEAAEEWMQGVISIERLDEGPIVEGSEWKETRKIFGKEATEYFEVKSIEPFEAIQLRCDGTKGTTGKGEYIFNYHVSDIPNGSMVTLNGEIKELSGIMKLLGKLLSNNFRKGCMKDLEALKEHLEKKDYNIEDGKGE